MKNDKELLMMAAKAAGLALQWRDMKGGYERILATPVNGGAEWNPLTDDGDALRLAVKLDMIIDVRGKYNAVAVWPDVVEQIDGDPLAATRRAIVRAAAAIGEKL